MTWLEIAATWDGVPLPAAERATVELAFADGWLEIAVEAPYHRDPPPSGPAASTNRLWQHEVVELFIAGDATTPVEYVEIELSPHGHYLVLACRGERTVVARELPLELTATIDGDRWRGRAALDRRLLPPPPHRANAFAIHGEGDRRRHLAAYPLPGAQPNFHQPRRYPRLAIAERARDA